MVQEHDVIEFGGEEYGKRHFLTDRFERRHEEFEPVLEAM